MGFMRQGLQNVGQGIKRNYMDMADPRRMTEMGPPAPGMNLAVQPGGQTMPSVPPTHGVGPNAQVPREEPPGMAQGRKLGFMLRSLLPGGMRPGEAAGMIRQPGLPQQPRPVQDIQGFKWSRGTMGANRSY